MDVRCELTRAGKPKMVKRGATPLPDNRRAAVRTGIGLIVFGRAATGTAPDARIRFEDTVVPSRISVVLDNGATPEKHQIETMIAGVAVFDYNNDGLDR